jgi:hypothetical protein
MEYQNYFIEYKQIDSNLFVKFTDKHSKISYENTITPEQIDNLPISKFIKILENCQLLIPNYNIIIEKLNNDNQLTLFLTYDIEIINLSYTIQLEKSSSTKTNDSLLKRIEQMEKIIDDNNQITIAKIYNLETYNYKMTNITNEYLRYSPKTEYIEVILPENKYDITTYKRNNYDIKFNYDIDSTQIFTNLKKIKLSDWKYLSYFMSLCKYMYPKVKSLNNFCYGKISSDNHKTTGMYAYYYNNTIEEIEITHSKYTNTYIEYEDIRHEKNTYIDVESEQNSDMTEIKEYNLITKIGYHVNSSDPFQSRSESLFSFSELHLPKMNKITVNLIESGYCFDFLLVIIKQCVNLKSLIFNKINLSDKKINSEYTLIQYGKSLSEIKEYCKDKKINLQIDEIIY